MSMNQDFNGIIAELYTKIFVFTYIPKGKWADHPIAPCDGDGDDDCGVYDCGCGAILLRHAYRDYVRGCYDHHYNDYLNDAYL